jgi:hypothetical protein
LFVQQKTKWMLITGAALIVVFVFLLLRSHSFAPAQPTSPAKVTVQKQPASASPPRVTPLKLSGSAQTNSSPDAAKQSNAADLYRQAFALYDALSMEDKDILADWKKEVDPAKAAELLQKIQPILNLLRQGAATGKCDWGLGKIGLATSTPHLGQGRNLGRVALWGAAQTFKSDPNAGAELVASELQLGKNVGDSTLLGMLVNSSMQRGAMELLCTNAIALNATATDKLVTILGATDYDESFFRSLDGESEMTAHFADDIESGKQPLNFDTVTNIPPAEAAAQLRQIADFQKAYLQAMESAEVDMVAWSNQVAAITATNAFAEMFLPSYDAVFEQARRTRVERTMISAGLTYRQEGAGALAKFPDPSTGQPFIYEPTTNGFRLRSTFIFREQPVSMSFPR